jgi:hypothetical protein
MVAGLLVASSSAAAMDLAGVKADVDSRTRYSASIETVEMADEGEVARGSCLYCASSYLMTAR